MNEALPGDGGTVFKKIDGVVAQVFRSCLRCFSGC